MNDFRCGRVTVCGFAIRTNLVTFGRLSLAICSLGIIGKSGPDIQHFLPIGVLSSEQLDIGSRERTGLKGATPDRFDARATGKRPEH
jgi:hypothetical protein